MLRHLLVNGSKRATIPDPQQSVLLWNFLLQDISSTGQQEVVLSLFRDMLSAGVHPDASTFPSVLHSCAWLLAPRIGQTIHALVCKSGCTLDPFVASTTLHMYAECGRMDEAHQAFNEMPQKNVVSWSTMIWGYAQIGQLEDVFALFRHMLGESGVNPNVVTMISLVLCWDGECVHACVVKLGLESHSLVSTSLVDMYLKCMDVEGAVYLFKRLKDKNLVSWLVMVCGLGKSDYLADAALTMSRMREFNVKPDSITLVDMYSSCGFLSVARTIFDHMTTRNLVVWNSIMHWHAREGNLEDAVMLFRELKHRLGS